MAEEVFTRLVILCEHSPLDMYWCVVEWELSSGWRLSLFFWNLHRSWSVLLLKWRYYIKIFRWNELRSGGVRCYKLCMRRLEKHGELIEGRSSYKFITRCIHDRHIRWRDYLVKRHLRLSLFCLRTTFRRNLCFLIYILADQEPAFFVMQILPALKRVVIPSAVLTCNILLRDFATARLGCISLGLPLTRQELFLFPIKNILWRVWEFPFHALKGLVFLFLLFLISLKL